MMISEIKSFQHPKLFILKTIKSKEKTLGETFVEKMLIDRSNFHPFSFRLIRKYRLAQKYIHIGSSSDSVYLKSEVTLVQF